MSADGGRFRTLPRQRRTYDLLGVVLVALLFLWIGVSGARHGRAGPDSLLLLAVVAAYVVGRLSAGQAPVLVPMVVAAVVSVAVLLSPAALTGDPLSAPLGYANANAALIVQGAAAAALGAVVTAGGGRAALLGWSVLLAACVPLTRSLTAAVLVVPVLLAAFLGSRVRRAAPLAVAGFAAVLATVALTLILAVSWETDAAARKVEGRLGSVERRVELWSDAIDLTTSSPLTGVGPGRFAHESPVARSDPDAAGAHSEPLQSAAELGLPGVALVLAISGWGFLALAGSEREPAVVAVGVAAWTALCVHSSVDYVLHFPALPVAAVVLLGVATARPSESALTSTRDFG
jgi:O-antigen ligase